MSDPRLNNFPSQYLSRASAVLETLRSHFVTMPRGGSFCDRDAFEAGYQTLSAATAGGTVLTDAALVAAVTHDPRAWVVLRCILGVSPGEAGYLAVEEALAEGETLTVEQTPMRDLDARAKRGEQLLFPPDKPARRKGQREADALLRSILPLLGQVLVAQRATPPPDRISRLDKVDTAQGQTSLVAAFSEGVSYSELLYERMLGRPYASHRDSVSRIVGNLIENGLRQLLEDYGIEGSMSKSREKVEGFEQAPDCRIPTVNPKVIIEAKLTEDDGTARDKVTRVVALRGYEDAKPAGARAQIIAIVDGRGFGHRMPDLRRLMQATDGHVYTLKELPLLVADGGPLAPFVTKQPPSTTANDAGQAQED
ncbi:MAG TPA: hypothetical protein VGM33_10070 [Baekduia sp.]